MASTSDDDFETVDCSVDDGTVQNVGRRSYEQVSEIAITKSAAKNTYKRLKLQQLSRQSATSISKTIQCLTKRLHGASYDGPTSLRVIHAANSMQLQYLKAKKKITKGDKLPPRPQIRKHICWLFAIGTKTYVKILSAYNSLKNKEYKTGERGNYLGKTTRVPRTKKVVTTIREFVRSERSFRKRITARQVLDLCISKKYLSIPRTNHGDYQKVAFASAYRSMRRWLHLNHYRSGQRTGNI